jgi:integrase
MMPEYNPTNEIIKKRYEEGLLHGRQRDPKTVRAVWDAITLFEKSTGCADFRTFNADQAKAFKAQMEKQTNRSGAPLSLSTLRSTLAAVREFFQWLAMEKAYMGKIDAGAVAYLHLSKNANRAARASRARPSPSLSDLERVLTAMPHATDMEQRDRAVVAFIAVTGVRDDAAVSLKRRHVDAGARTVWQDPKCVRTKGRKGIVTRFVSQALPMAEGIVLDWLAHLDGPLDFGPNDPLFPKTRVEASAETLSFEARGLSREHWANAAPVREIFKKAFTAVGLPYANPHSLRNTLCKWGLKNLTQREFKALSQNLGHEYAMTTYNSYARLSEDEQIEALAGVRLAGEHDLSGVPSWAMLEEMHRREKNRA